jgi:uncharacterized protein (UPF0332 family)
LNEIQRLKDKAERSLGAAEGLFQRGDYDFSASRAYYAMFYLAEAVLLTKGLSFSRHKGVISGFWEHFIKTGIFDKALHKALNDAFEIRKIGDYASSKEVSKEEAENVLRDARIFLSAVKGYFEETSLD